MSFAAVVIAAISAFAQLSLDAAQQFAVSNNVDVQTALATVRQKDAMLRVARAGGFPHLSADYSLSPQASANNRYTVEAHYWNLGINVSINDILAASPATQSAAGELLAAQREADAAVLRARVNATDLYFTALQAIATERMRRADLLGAQRDRSAASLRYRTGEAPNLDLVRADVSLAQAQAAFVRAQADRVDAVAALAAATGVSPDELASLGGSVVIPAPELDPLQATRRALAARPELVALLATIEARRADVAAARQSALPTATVSAGYQRGVDSELGVQGPAVAAHVDLPIASASAARTESAQSQVDIARAQLIDERRLIALEVANAVRDARARASASEAAVEARDEAARALAAVEIGYREGASSSLDVADARRTFQQAELDALVASYQQAQALATLEVIVP
ncbi:MAG: TolC family protein [Candidatus Eremiobacteraeota bacterium]|nr:TolC family protein [Candidatus Eremiobacteraeota bacterium]